jgi:aspartate/methionine/tyrosine aminotransferase
VEPADEVVVMLPNYLQIWGLARGFGANTKAFHLRADRAWEPDLDELNRAVTGRTKLIAVCNPNNPTGAILSPESMQAIIAAARRSGAWLLSDEVYRGAERDGVTTPSFWGAYERTLITSGLSKAYGTPGLRIGWIAGPPEVVDELWGYHDYTAITVSTISDRLAREVFEKRDQILNRTRRILTDNFPVFENWFRAHADVFLLPPTRAGAIGYPSYDLPIGSSVFTDRLRREKSLLLVPGAHFAMEHCLRINYGVPPSYLCAGLSRLEEMITEIRRNS